MSQPKIVLYGASGYTGKHIAWKLAARGIAFIAAGRNKARLEQQLAGFPELKGAEYQVVEVGHDEDQLTRLFEGKEVVHNLVGPYMQLGQPVVKAALAAGCHYIDCSGEQDWMLYLQEHFAQRFLARGLALLPATGSMWNSGALVSELVLETPGIDTLDISYTLAGSASVGTTLSYMRMCCQPQFFLDNNALVAWPPAQGVSITVPGIHQVLAALPWSGGGEAVWYAHDDRVRNCSTLVAFRNQALMNLVIARMTEFSELHRHASPAEQEAVTNRWAMDVAPGGEPPREDPNTHRVLFSVHGRGALVARSLAVWGVTGYLMTGVLGAVTIDTLLRGRATVRGMVPAARLVGARKMLAELMDEGVYGAPVETLG